MQDKRDVSSVRYRWNEATLTVATLALLVASLLLDAAEAPARVQLSVNVLAYLTGGWFASINAFNQLRERTLDVDFLMLLAALGAATIGNWHEGITLLFLFSLSNTLQAFAMDRSRRAIDKLLQNRPTDATVLVDGEEHVVQIDALRVRDIVILRPGEMAPTDGVVRSGQTEMNQASITGESKPSSKSPGDDVFAGAINGTGSIEFEVTRRAEDSTLARIVKMVESAESHKAKSQRFLERLEGGYTWTILTVVALFILVPLAFGRPFTETFYRAMVLLVVASPCALILSTPASILSAIANAARHGVLFKGGAYLEKMADIHVVIFDKTGTLTTGKPGVTDLVLSAHAPEGFTEDDVLAYAAALESRSEHPLAHEIVEAAKRRNLEPPQLEDFVSLPGRGVYAKLDGFKVWIGGSKLYREHGEPIPEELMAAKKNFEHEGKTVLVLHRELERRGNVGVHEPSGGWLGLIALADTVRPEAKDAIAQLKAMGVHHTVMLTGDHGEVAKTISAEVGIDEYHADLMPEDKVTLVKEFAAKYGDVMMVGDGVNDAPALATASVGLAMGAAGTDVALESAHCVLMGDDLRNIPFALNLSRRAVRTVKQNLIFSMGVIVVLVSSVLFFTLPLPLGVVGHEGSTLIVCANGLRLLRSK